MTSERPRPVRPQTPSTVECDDLELRPVFVDQDHPPAGFARDLEFQTRDASFRIFLEVHQQAFDERVPGCEEIDRLVFNRVLAIERAHEGRSRRHAREAVDERLVAELDCVSATSADLLDVEPQSRSGADDDLLDEGVEAGWNASEDGRTELGAIRLAMQLAIRRFVDARACGLRVRETRPAAEVAAAGRIRARCLRAVLR